MIEPAADSDHVAAAPPVELRRLHPLTPILGSKRLIAIAGAAGIGVLVATANRAREAGGSLSLLAPSRQVRRLLDILHLDAILPAAQSSGGPFVAGSAA